MTAIAARIVPITMSAGRISLRIDGDAQAGVAGALSGRASVARFGRALAFSPGMVKKAVVVATVSAQPMDETNPLCHSAMPSGPDRVRAG